MLYTEKQNLYTHMLHAVLTLDIDRRSFTERNQLRSDDLLSLQRLRELAWNLLCGTIEANTRAGL